MILQRAKPQTLGASGLPISILTYGEESVNSRKRELECRRLEARGEQPPNLPDEIYDNLTEEQRLRVSESMIRAGDIASEQIIVHENSDDANRMMQRMPMHLCQRRLGK